MSEVEPSIGHFRRHLPQSAANDRVNAVFRQALRDAVSSVRTAQHPTRDKYTESIIAAFYESLGTGSIETRVEDVTRAMSDEFVARPPRSETALKYVDRFDFRSYSHPAVLSPLIGLARKTGDLCYIGTDKLGHFVQQGYDYWIIYHAIESLNTKKGLGELFAYAWGYWSEGEEISDEAIAEYLRVRSMPVSEEIIKGLRHDINRFLEDSETIELMSPTPDFAKPITTLRELAHFIGTHEFGILGSASSGIISYADLRSNEAGLRFYLDLERDPEYLAEHFDIADYVTPDWDEDVLKPRYLPVIKRRIDEAISEERDSYSVHGIGVSYEAFDSRLAVTFPLFTNLFGDMEWRSGLGLSVPLSMDGSRIYDEGQIFANFDYRRRVSGLHFVGVSAEIGATRQVVSEPVEALHPVVKGCYELMLLGWTSFHMCGGYDVQNNVPAVELGFLSVWR